MTDFHKTNLEIGLIEEKNELDKLKKSIKSLQLEFIKQIQNKLSVNITDNDLEYLLTELNKVYC